MKKLILKSMMLLSVLALTFTSCSDNDDKVVTTPVSLSIEMPLGLENIVLSNAKAVFTNVTTNGKRLRVYTIVDFSFIRTFAPSF